MATLKYTIAISSDDAFPQAVAFSRTSTIDIDGDSDGATNDADVMQLSGGDQVCFMYKHEDGTAKDVQVKSDTGTAYFSYAFCELT